jgi:predicted aminopeptidase
MQFKIPKRKHIFWAILGLVCLFAILYCNLIIYGFQQASGQLNLVWNTQTFEEFLHTGKYPDSTKQKFRTKIALIREIKDFAVKDLGLNDTKNYERIYDQQNRAILWAVSASDKFALKPKMWNYAFLGDMPYRGSFDSLRSYKLAKSLEQQGYDVNVYSPSAWSTLGWLRDPVLSSMLYWNEGDLASLIIHEMTHSTVWVYGGVEYNENLADFIGDNGAERFLKKKYGENSKEFRKFANAKLDNEKIYRHVLKTATQLDSLYKTFEAKTYYTLAYKLKLKANLIQNFADELANIGVGNGKRVRKWLKKLPNNAFFMMYRVYRAKQNEFEEECKKTFSGNLLAYIAYLKKKYPV